MTVDSCLQACDVLALERALEEYDPASLELHTRLHRPRQPWQVHCAGQALTLYWNSRAPGQDATLVEVWLALGDAPVHLALPVQALVLLDLPGSLALPGLPAALLLEQALLPLIETLERCLTQPLRVLDQAAPLTCLHPLAIDVTLRCDDLALPVRLRTDAQGWASIADGLDRHAPLAPHALGSLPLALVVDGGEAWLTLGELGSLLPGDVVMLDPWPDDQVRLRLGTNLQARAQRQGNRLQLLAPLFIDSAFKEPYMSEPDAGPELDSSLDELQLKLVCQVGSVELTLAQLRELGTGSVLSLTPRMHDGVDLMINGRRVGQGQLVKIGDGLGVRLLSFAVS
ncbi:type III secretion system cytoplasmic ring protein SctQ [Pseudomonas sp. X10]